MKTIQYSNLPDRLLREGDARKLLKPYFETIAKCIEDGWSAWTDHYSDRHHVLDARARACIVSCEIVDAVRHRFMETPGVKFLKKRGLYFLYIGDEIVLRFKKLDKKGRTKNIRTRQQALIEVQIPLPGTIPGTVLNAGYTLDDLQQEIDELLVSCQLRTQVVYKIDLPKTAAERVVFPEKTPVAGIDRDGAETFAKVKDGIPIPKAEDEQK